MLTSASSSTEKSPLNSQTTSKDVANSMSKSGGILFTAAAGLKHRYIYIYIYIHIYIYDIDTDIYTIYT